MIRFSRLFLILFVSMILTLWGCSAFTASVSARCPPKEKLQRGIQKTFPKLQFEITKISPSEVPGLCQIQMKIGAQMHLLYADSQGDFVLAGNLHELKTGRNLTQETVQLLNRLTPEELLQIEPLTTFTLGQGKKVVYLATDPQCPYCQQAEILLKKLLVEKEELQVRFLFFPLDSHQGAKEQCISILCDNKGIEGFDSGYQSGNQCPEGIKKVNNTTAFLQKKGINSTPTFIFMDGIYLVGLPSEEVLRSKLGLSKPLQK